MVTISKDNDVVTLINVFTVRPEDQQRLVDVLANATQTVMRNQPGFVSANIHKSLDGTRVTNYAQWQSSGAFEAMLQNREAAEHMGEAAKVVQSWSHPLWVSFKLTSLRDRQRCFSLHKDPCSTQALGSSSDT